MIALRYTLAFLAAVVVLSAGTVFAFSRVGAMATATSVVVVDSLAAAGPPPVPAAGLIRPHPAEYESFARDDAAWRAVNAREYTLAELRARGDGRRSPREALQDRVYAHVRDGRRGEAIRELERWVAERPRDEEALLWLARLLGEAGRADEAAARYRALLALERRGQ